MSLPDPARHRTPAPRPMATRVDQWLTNRAASGILPGTMKVQGGVLRRVAAAHNLDTITPDELAAWLANPKWKPETRRVYFTALQGYFRWAVQQGYRTDDPTASLTCPRVPRTVAKPVPEGALGIALSLASPQRRLMILLAAHAGLRRAEIAGLRKSDLTGDLLTITGKGGKARVIPVSGELLERLQSAPPGWIFPSPMLPGRHIHPETVGHVARLLPPGYTAHKLRHRYASRIYHATHDIMAVQELLGHSSPNTTRRYVLTDMDDLRRAAATAV